ncbi:hypothetical protein [Vibrio cyclitrophicus]|uniref:hypothetical protein n=1 Tax=Vibrio cyclitrophicus TaxID=47951 RepID=UPI0032E3E52C
MRGNNSKLEVNANVANSIEQQEEQESIPNEAKEEVSTSMKSQPENSSTESTSESNEELVQSNANNSSNEQENIVTSDKEQLPKNKHRIGNWLGGFALLSILTGGAWIYFSSDQEFLNLVNLSDNESPNPSANEIQKLKFEMENLQIEVEQYIGVNEAVADMEQQTNNLKNRIDNLKILIEDEIENFGLESAKREERLAEISGRLSELKLTENFTVTIREEMESLRSEIRGINDKSYVSEQEMIKKLETLKESLDLADNGEVTVKKSSAANDDSTYGVTITQLGPLKLGSIVAHGSQRVAELSDDISGAIPIIEGDQVGQYKIKRITSNSVLILSLSGKKFTLIQEG